MFSNINTSVIPGTTDVIIFFNLITEIGKVTCKVNTGIVDDDNRPSCWVVSTEVLGKTVQGMDVAEDSVLDEVIKEAVRRIEGSVYEACTGNGWAFQNPTF